MSLLPEQIIPENVPLGRVIEDQVIIDHNWWLLIYNLCAQVLGTAQAGGLPADALQDLESADLDAIDSDSIALRLPIASLANLIPTEGDPVPSIQDVRNALILAQDVLLQDPIPRAPPVQSVTVGSSPFTYTAYSDGIAVITGGTVSSVSYSRQGTSVATGLMDSIFPLRRADQLVVTYTLAPTMTFMPN